MKSKHDENLLKFKKAHETLINTVGQLVCSDKYLAGDLGIKADGTLIDGTHSGDYKYFCKTFAELISTNSVNCVEDGEVGINVGKVDTKYDAEIAGGGWPPDVRHILQPRKLKQQIK